MDEPDPSPPRLRPLARAMFAGMVTFGIVFVLLMVLRRPADPPVPAYSDASRAAFVEACTSGDGASRAVCTCVYEALERSVPFDRYVALNAEVDARVAAVGSTPSAGPATTPSSLPSEVGALVAACVARQPAGPSTAGPTTVTAAPAPTAPLPGGGGTITLSGGSG